MPNWLQPGATWAWMHDLVPLSRALADAGPGAPLTEAWERVQALRPAVDRSADHWHCLGNWAIKVTGRHSLQYPKASAEGVANPFNIALLYETVLAIRTLWLAAPRLADMYLVRAESAPGHRNPYESALATTFDVPSLGNRVADNFLHALYLESLNDFLFLEFATSGSTGWSREHGLIRINIDDLWPLRRQSGEPSGGGSGNYFTYSGWDRFGFRPEPALLALRRWRAAGAVSDDLPGGSLDSAIESLGTYVGVLAHELGHKVWFNVYGYSSGITNQYEGRSRFGIYGRRDSSGVWVPFPAISGSPTRHGREVTRHWVIQWVTAAVDGFARRGDEAGVAERLSEFDWAACFANQCQPSQVGSTGYLAPPRTVPPGCDHVILDCDEYR